MAATQTNKHSLQLLRAEKHLGVQESEASPKTTSIPDKVTTELSE